MLTDTLASWVGERLVHDGIAAEDDGPFGCELLEAPQSGNSNLTLPFLIHWPGGELPLVLRLQHPDNQIFLDADVLCEYQVLRALDGSSAIASPRPRWAEPDRSVLGHPFFVMDRIAGSVPAGMPSIHATGWLFERTATERESAWESAITAVAAVHGFDWPAHAPWLADGANGTTIRTRLAHLATWYSWVTGGRAFPVTDAGLAHLQASVDGLAESGAALLWGDARMGNIIFGPDHRVAALLDWELASVGPPALDLAWWLTFEEFSTTAHGIRPLAGYPDRRRTIDRYTELAGAELVDLEWYETLSAWIITVTVIRMADIAVAAGRLPAGTRMGHGNLTAQMLARRIGVPIPDLDPDYARRRHLTIDSGHA